MPNFTSARVNMVDSQIHTMGVVNDAILEAYRTVPREDFVPEDKRAIAYCDEDLPVGSGRCLMEPVTHARLMQAAQPSETDRVLDIGGATGYSAAIFSKIASRVVAVESDADLLSSAESSWNKANANNILPHHGSFADGVAGEAPFSLIFLNGSVCEIPGKLLEQLAPNGRLVAVVRKPSDRIGRAMLYTKSDTGSIGERVLFDAAVPYLPGHAPRTEFVF